MFEKWDEDLPEEETNAKLKKLAWEIRRRKLETPAILLFESHKPLSYLGGQATVFFAPFLVPILGHDNVRDWSRLLNRRDAVDRLLQYIDLPMEELEDHTAVEGKG
jgi:hypothetical protein